MKNFKKAQGATEYAIFIAAVLVALISLQVYFQRAVKGNMKQRSDAIGDQFTAHGEAITIQTQSQSFRESYQGMHNKTIDGEEKYFSSSSHVLKAGPDSELMGAIANIKRNAKDTGSEMGTYAGIAYSNTDYVDYDGDTYSGEASEAHSALDSGKFSKTSLYDEAGLGE